MTMNTSPEQIDGIFDAVSAREPNAEAAICKIFTSSHGSTNL